MEFKDKLQELRKNQQLTQEELAEALYVSRTAISKWESGRGYPSIESLKSISTYFNVTIDDLLSADKIISIAEKETATKIHHILDTMIGFCDLLYISFIILPLYPKTMNDYIYAVNLLAYDEITSFNLMIYWMLFIGLMLLGILQIGFKAYQLNKYHKLVRACSYIVHCVAIIVLALAAETYAAALAFLLFIIKALLLWKHMKA